MFKWVFGAFLALFTVPSISIAADFYLHFGNCSMTVGHLVLSKDSLKTFKGDGSLRACTRLSQSIRCDIDFLDGKGKRKAEYTVHLDMPPMLIFTDANMADYYVIDLTQHAATLITRVMDTKFAGAKVCHGMYMTESERRHTKESKQQ